MKFGIFLSLIMIGLLTHCAPAPKPPEPVRPSPEPMPLAPEVAPSPAPAKAAPLTTEPQPQPRPYIHEVRWGGETLSHIALWYTGAQSNWQKIVKANPNLNPRSIHQGYKILIPEELLKKRTPMPRDFVESISAPKKHASAPVSQPSKERGIEELFEPVEVLSPSGTAKKDELYGPIELYRTPTSP